MITMQRVKQANTSFTFLATQIKKNVTSGLNCKDNAPAHKGVLVMKNLRDLKYELLKYSPYFLDLDLSDNHLYSES